MFSFSLLSALSYVPLFPTYATITTCLLYFFTSTLLSSLQRPSSNHDYFVHTQFHTRLTGFLLLLPALSCLFICARLQFDEGSWSGTFWVSLSQEFLCGYVVVSVVLVAFAYLSIPFSLILVSVGLFVLCTHNLLSLSLRFRYLSLSDSWSWFL